MYKTFNDTQFLSKYMTLQDNANEINMSKVLNAKPTLTLKKLKFKK